MAPVARACGVCSARACTPAFAVMAPLLLPVHPVTPDGCHYTVAPAMQQCVTLPPAVQAPLLWPLQAP